MPESYNRATRSYGVVVELPTHREWVDIIEKRLLKRSGAILQMPLEGLSNVPSWLSSVKLDDSPSAVVRLEKHDGIEYRMVLRPQSEEGQSRKEGIVLTVNLRGVLTFFVEQPIINGNEGPVLSISSSQELVVPEGEPWKQLQADSLVDSIMTLLQRETTTAVPLANFRLQRQVRGDYSPS